MRFVSTRALARGATVEDAGVSFKAALFDGLAPDGGLYVPERLDSWGGDELSRLPGQPLADIGVRVLAPFIGDDIQAARSHALIAEALNFPIPLVAIEPGVYALELFHGPTLAFKDVGARVMARLMGTLHDGGDPLTVLAATSGDTGGAVAHAFHGVPHTRVIVLYPHGRVSPTQEAQLTMFNAEAGNVRAYAVSGSFDDCQRLVKEAFSSRDLRGDVRLTSANSINIGRLLPQMIYYAHGVAQALEAHGGDARLMVATPSGNFGNLTAGLMQKRAGLPIARFVAATNANDIVPAYLESGRYEPRPSVQTIANAMDVGDPSNFDRMMWLYARDLDAIRRDVAGSRHTDGDVREAIRRVYGERGYLLDPHSAIAYLGLKAHQEPGQVGICVATAHPAKFGEVVEPVLGQSIPKPEPLLDALTRAHRLPAIRPTLEAVADVVRRQRSKLMAGYLYRADVLEMLVVHGVYPTDRTSPWLAREFVRDLYRFEIRRLRERLLKHEFPRHEYTARVIELRDKYPVLALRARQWVLNPPADVAPPDGSDEFSR